MAGPPRRLGDGAVALAGDQQQHERLIEAIRALPLPGGRP